MSLPTKGPRQTAWDDYAAMAPQDIRLQALKQIKHIFFEGYTVAMRDIANARNAGTLDELLQAFKEEIDAKRSATNRLN